MAHRAKRLRGPLAALCLIAASAGSHQAHAAGGAYVVDTSEVSGPGSCKVESWASFASNRDFFAAVSPSCIFEFYKLFELGAQLSRSRADDDWARRSRPS